MTTNVTSLGLTSPVTFLNSTVLSFNGNLGFGGQESSLTVELVDDCDTGQGFPGINSNNLIGSPQFFPTNSGSMQFSFAGIVTDWKINESSGGKTYSVTLSDPRRLLENVMIVVDTYSGPLISGPNVYNAYRYYEPRESLESNCVNFGTSGTSSDRGMPYYKAIQALQDMNIITYTPTGYALYVDLSSINSLLLPEYYRVNGPAISLLQLVTDVAEATGYDFYVYLSPNGGNWIIRFYFIDLKQPVNFGAVNWIVSNFENSAIDRSYGRELRIEKEKTVVLGEKVHYLMPVTEFVPFFGENQACEPVPAVPSSDGCGFQVLVNTAPLAASMRYNFTVGNLVVTEMDIRAALGSFQLWKERAQTVSIPGTFNAAIRAFLAFHEITNDPKQAFDDLSTGLNVTQASLYRSTADIANNPNKSNVNVTVEAVNEDLQKIHNYIVTLGRTYYGKQYLCRLNQNICYKPLYGEVAAGQNCISSERVYTAEPTNDGGWIDGGSVLGLSDPFLGFFKQDDGRIGSFALFNISGDIPPGTTNS
jgi:hypothetical protein